MERGPQASLGSFHGNLHARSLTEFREMTLRMAEAKGGLKKIDEVLKEMEEVLKSSS
jgi:hypothetical protein